MKASDHFTLGLVAYKILTGNDLFTGSSIKEIIENRNRFFDKKNRSYKKTLLSALRSPDLIELIEQKKKHCAQQLCTLFKKRKRTDKNLLRQLIVKTLHQHPARPASGISLRVE